MNSSCIKRLLYLACVFTAGIASIASGAVLYVFNNSGKTVFFSFRFLPGTNRTPRLNPIFNDLMQSDGTIKLVDNDVVQFDIPAVSCFGEILINNETFGIEVLETDVMKQNCVGGEAGDRKLVITTSDNDGAFLATLGY